MKCQKSVRMFDGVGFESLEPRLLLAGDVLATLSQGTLKLAGDAGNNEIRITEDAADTFRVTGVNGTTVNGGAFAVFGPGTTSISLKDLGGNDTVTVDGINLDKNVTIKVGDGNDTVAVLNSTAVGTVTLDGGKGTDLLTVLNSTAGKEKEKNFENLNNAAPVFTSSATPNVPENTTAVATVTATDADVPAQTVTYSITGGADAAKFNIVGATGVLTFVTAPNFEVPTDANADNVYLVQVTAADGAGLTTAQNLTVTVTDANDAPVFTTSATPSVPENTTPVVTVNATDADVPAQTVTYSITGGADAAKFNIVGATGVLTFVTAPDFEVPTDANADNVYLVQVTAADGAGGTTAQNLSVTVTPVEDNGPVFTSSTTPNVAENTTAAVTVNATDADLPAQTVTYSITGGADAALFTLNGTTGALAFLTAPDFEVPTDANADNVYVVQVTADDGAGSTTAQSLNVTVTNMTTGLPTFTSPAAWSMAENNTVVGTVVAVDEGLQPVTYSIVGGVDAALFTINGVTGVLSFLAAPDFELPADAGANNAYNVDVQASNGTFGGNTTQNLTVTVTNVADT